jgi:hypothetical protein
VDGDGVTGAAERAAELEGLQFTDLDDEEDEHGEYVDEPIVEDALDGQLETEDVVDAPAANEMDLNNEVDEAGAGLESDDQAPADLKPDDEAAASDDETAAGLESDDDVDGKPQD